jgi:ABC-type polysaccharide/polyol phosphate transport system ATPase subunit
VKTAVQSIVGEASLQPGREGELFEANRSTQRVISFEGVSKSYFRKAGRGLLRNRLLAWLKGTPVETFRALDDISFDVRAGESLAIVGANGAGKSTLLRLATGISMPDSGSVTVHGTIAALMELGAGFHPDLTGAENLVLNASLLGLSRKRTYEEFDSILEFSGIADFIDEPLRTYSSGMVLRLAFSVAVRVNPDVLFLDEVLAVGDQEFKVKCLEEIKRLKRLGKTLVYVSHQTEVTRELCDVALWLEHGKLKMFGPATTVLDSYEAVGPAKKQDLTQK